MRDAMLFAVANNTQSSHGVKVDAKGKEKMNATSGDEVYNERLAAHKAAMKGLGARIEPKVYEYGFLKK